MATNSNFNLSAQSIQTAPTVREFVRKDDGGLILIREEDGVQTITPVQTTVRVEGNRLIIGLAPRPVAINWPNGQTTFLPPSDGVYQNPETGEFEIWINGEAVAWSNSKPQAERSYFELEGAY